MGRTASRLRRGLLCSIVVAAGGALFGVASAGAAVTQSQITSPSSPFIYQFDTNASPPPTVTITGTTNSSAPGSDTIDINCYYAFGSNTDYQSIATNVPLNPDGSFSWTGPVDQDGYSCQLRAVPSGYGNSYPWAPFAGVFSELDSLSQYYVNGPGTPADDYYYTAAGPVASNYYGSVGGCGLFTGAMQSSTTFDYSGTWDCAAALYARDGLSNRSEILIDGKNAYDSTQAKRAYSDTIAAQNVNSGQAPGFPALTSSYAKDAATGNVTIHESQGLVSCADASYPATEAKCGGTAGSDIGSWQSDGVSFARTISQTSSGQVVTVTDTYSSTDGQAHSLDLEYDNYADESGEPVWKFPGAGSYQSYAAGDQASLSGKSLDVINVSDGYNPNGSLQDGPGALIYSTQPNSAQFSSHRELMLGYQRSVPAGGSITLTQTYVTGKDQATVDSIVNGIVDQTYKPTVSITSPNNGTVTTQSSAQVSGKAAAHDGLALKVNGAPVAVNPDGTWSTALSLHSGSNTVTAVASDGSGNTAQATDTVIYSPTKQQTFCVVPNVTRDKLAKAKTALKKANCRVGKIHKVRSSKFRKGTVEHASYSPSVVLKSGTKVGLTEVIGKPKARRHRTSKKHGRRS